MDSRIAVGHKELHFNFKNVNMMESGINRNIWYASLT